MVAVALPEAGLVRRRRARCRAATWRSSRSSGSGSRAGAGQPCSGVSGSPSASYAIRACSSSSAAIGTFDVKPCSAWATTKRAARLRLAPARRASPSSTPRKLRVEAAPARHAVDVDRHFARRQRPELVPAQRDRILDLAEDLEVPGREVGRRARRPRGGRATSRSGTAPAAAARGRSRRRRPSAPLSTGTRFLH